MIGIFLILSLLFTSLFSVTSLAAPSWPSDVSIQAEGGILIDADSGCVIYGKNIHETFYPASITKILTALLVIENCSLDDTVTFSYNAVHNVEPGSTSAGYNTGDQISVRQALYVMLLKSANEVANALAEHCAGSIEKFADMMNEKAASLGCTDSHFANPSGLNDENHYTTPYDFALIARAAFENPVFVEIDSTTYFELPPNGTNDESFTVYCGHKMLKKSSGLYYPGIIGGKTGYTTSAGNTLVTCAERDGLKLITVILNGHQTHYDDTKALLDFGFENFRSLSLSESGSGFSDPESDFDLTGSRAPLLSLEEGRTVTLPAGASLGDAETEISYDLPDSAPDGAAALVTYTYEDRVIGTAYLMGSSEVSVMQGSAADAAGASGSGSEGAGTEGLGGLIAGLRAAAEQTPSGLLLAVTGISLLILCLVVLIVRKFRKDRDAAERSLSQSMHRYRSEGRSGGNEGIYTDLSGSENSYFLNQTPRSRRKIRHRIFQKKG